MPTLLQISEALAHGGLNNVDPKVVQLLEKIFAAPSAEAVSKINAQAKIGIEHLQALKKAGIVLRGGLIVGLTGAMFFALPQDSVAKDPPGFNIVNLMKHAGHEVT